MTRNMRVGFSAMLVVLALVAAPGNATTLGDEPEFDEWDAQECHIAYARAQLALFPAKHTELQNRMDVLAILYPFVPLFPQAPKSDDARRELAATLQYCEQMLQFQPPIDFSAYLLPSRPDAQYPTDFDCAVSYWLYGAFRPDEQQAALEFARFSLGKHYAANPHLDPATLGPQMAAEGQARGERIQQGQETTEGLTADLDACEAKYGFGQAGQ